MTGCRDTSRPAQEAGIQEQQTFDESGNDTNTSQEDMVSWLITESALPLPEDTMTQDILKEDNWAAREKESCFWDGTFYRLSDLFEMVDEKNMIAGACIQVLSSPYEQWADRAYFYQEHYEDDIRVWVSELAGVAEDRSPFLESAFAVGETDDTLYGIPYYCYPYFMSVSDSLKDADSWTLEEMYEAVRNSPAEVLEQAPTA